MKTKTANLLFQSLIFIALSISTFSQSNSGLIKVIVSPDHNDWTYKVNEKATFEVQVLKYGNLVENVTIDYEIGPEKIQPTVKDPADFDTFWTNAISEARKTALDPEVYNNLNAGGLYSYPTIRLNDRDNHYYKRVYLGCVKAVDFIFTLPEFNGIDVAVTGGSQGGALTIVTAGLDKRIKYMAAQFPALCDHAGYLNNRAGGWPHYFRNEKPKPGEVETLEYYDVVNFAKRVSAPGYYTWGFNDLTCPPTSTYSAYNVIKAQKELHIFQETGHWTFPEQIQALNTWLTDHLLGK